MTSSNQNIERIERVISIAAGVAAIAGGVYRGGPMGIVKALGGAALLQRGISGHCTVKGLITDPETELAYLRERVAELRAQLPKLEEEVARRRRSVDAKTLEAKVDNAVEETFPASDPISP